MATLRWQIRNWNFVIQARKIQWAEGVNSDLADGKHVPMLDIEGLSARQVENEARRIQELFSLGSAHIFHTGKHDHWHVYYMTRVDFDTLITIMVNFANQDKKHTAWSASRGHATIRFSAKSGREIKFYTRLSSRFPDTFDPNEFDSFTKYQTGDLE